LNKTGEEDSSSEEEEEVKEEVEVEEQRDTKVKFADDVAVAE
jgi:hypothetical protein